MRAISWDLPLDLGFVECDTCRAKPGSPTLCLGCLRNRAVIEALTDGIEPIDRKLAEARAARILWPQR